MQNSLAHPYDEMRQFRRRPFSKTIVYVLHLPEPREEKRLALRGKGIDISDCGIGIETDYPLAPGHTLWLDDETERKVGVVRWCVRAENNYRAGIELDAEGKYPVGPDTKAAVPRISEETERYFALLNESTERFNRELAEIEKRCGDTGEDPDELLGSVRKTIDDVLAACDVFERGIKNAELIKQTRTVFRERTNSILSKSYCINRTRTWPQGHQGDYKTLEIAYRNAPLSKGIGYYLDLYLLSLPLGDAVRNRIKMLGDLLGQELSERKNLSVLNVGCGSCRELMGIADVILDSGAKITCIDSNDDALAFAQDRLSNAEILPRVELRKYNAIRMFDDELNMTEFGKQDIIYSVGLFDYLPDDFLVKLFGALYRLLNPGGKLIAAFKDASRYRAIDFHWIVDWDGFLQRTEDDFLNLLHQAGIDDESLSAEREDSGIIIFYIATK